MSTTDVRRALVKAGVDEHAADIVARRSRRPDFNLSLSILAVVTVLGFTLIASLVTENRRNLDSLSNAVNELKVENAEIKAQSTLILNLIEDRLPARR